MADPEGPERPEDRWGPAMAAAQKGDEVAYRELLEELLPFVRRQVRSRITVRDDAEDVVQNALIAVHRGRHTYQPQRPFGPWVRTVVRNCMIDWFRERGRRASRELAVDEPELFSEGVRDEEPGARELAPWLSKALQELPDKQRQAVELVQLRGLSIAEAAVEVGVTPGALKVRAHRGYRALRARLADGQGRDDGLDRDDGIEGTGS